MIELRGGSQCFAAGTMEHRSAEEAEAASRQSISDASLTEKQRRSVIIFGDSWAEDNTHVKEGLFQGVRGWPTHLAASMDTTIIGNFAVGQSESKSLFQQLQRATKVLGKDAEWSQYVVMLHSGGNDFIGAEKGYNPFAAGNFWIPHCTWGFKRA